MEAVALWRHYPGELASDLSQFHHRRIADWHAGVMPSYELLELAEFMDDDGRYKTARRGGEASEHRRALLQTANETAMLRVGMVPDADGDTWGAQLFLPAYKIRQAQAEAAADGEARESIFAMADVSGQE